MAYIDFTYYQTTFGGTTIPETDFLRYERKARIALDNFTFDRLKKDSTLIDDLVRDCMCEMMEKAYSIEQEEAATEGKLIASESVDGHSVTYAISDSEKNLVDKSKATKIKLYNITKEYLGNTGLMYRGLDNAN
jgi:hypothetical protein